MMNTSKNLTSQSPWTTSQLINLSQSLASAYGCDFEIKSQKDPEWLQRLARLSSQLD